MNAAELFLCRCGLLTFQKPAIPSTSERTDPKFIKKAKKMHLAKLCAKKVQKVQPKTTPARSKRIAGGVSRRRGRDERGLNLRSLTCGAPVELEEHIKRLRKPTQVLSSSGTGPSRPDPPAFSWRGGAGALGGTRDAG